MQMKFDLEWSFDASLRETEALGVKLKPLVHTWASKTYPTLLKRLKHDRLANNSTAVEIISSEVPGRLEPVWLVVGMCVNRTIKSDCVAGVGATKEFAEVLYNAFSVSDGREGKFFYPKRIDYSSSVLPNVRKKLNPSTLVSGHGSTKSTGSKQDISCGSSPAIGAKIMIR